MNTKRILSTLLLFLLAMMLVMCGQPPQPEPTIEPTTTPSITPLPQTLTLARSVFGCLDYIPKLPIKPKLVDTAVCGYVDG